MSRLSYVIKDTNILTSTALMYARRELVTEITGEFSDSFEEDLELFTLLTGEQVTNERSEKILHGTKYGWDRVS